MVSFLHARAVNDVVGDPVVFLDFQYSKRALLFDLGTIDDLTDPELMRVTHVFVSHMHMDHFCGFDRLLRLRLDRPGPLHVAGPAGSIDRVAAKLNAYTWNLLNGDSVDFALTTAEFSGGVIARRALFRARTAFRQEDASAPMPRAGCVVDEAEFSVRAAVLDHGTTSLAFAFEEKARVHVVDDKLAELGLLPGPWLNRAKDAIRLGLDASTPIATGAGRAMELGRLQDLCLTMRPGLKIAYVVDAADHRANGDAIVDLARDADQLFIEAAFADEDADLARARHHLTAGAAGRLARDARVKSVVPLHASARYRGQTDRLVSQLEQAFRPTVPAAVARSERPSEGGPEASQA